MASSTHPALDDETLLGRDLVERGLITREQLDETVRSAARDGRTLLDVLVERGFVPEERRAALAPRRFETLPCRFGKFELQEEVGRGGMGRVYRAWQEDLRRTVAIKVVEIFTRGSTRAMTDRERSDLAAEAGAVGRLAHPNIVQVLEVGRIDEEDYICLEYVAGASLREFLKVVWLTPEHGRRFVRRRRAALLGHLAALAGALEYAHGQGVMHRDIKPGNILVSFDPEAGGEQELPEIQRLKLTDFGLAIDLDQGPRTGEAHRVIGTPGYLSPEQARGRGFRFLPAGDIYALGLVAYEIFTGVSPFLRATEAESIRAVREETPLPPSRINPDLDPSLEAVVMGCLQPEAWERFPNGEELCRAIEACLRGEPVEGPADPHVSWPHILPRGPERTTEATLARARERLEEGDLGRALADLMRVLEKLPDHLEARMDRGTVFLALGDPERAIEDWATVIEQDPGRVEARVRRALALRWLGRSGEAVADYEQALEAAPPEWQGRAAVERALRRLKTQDSRP